MTIIKRLRLSYIILVFLPIALFSIAGIIVDGIYTKKLTRIKFSVQTVDFNNTFYNILGSNPDLLLQDSTLNDIINLTDEPNKMLVYILVDGELSKSYGNTNALTFRSIKNIKYVNYWLFNNSRGEVCEIFIINRSLLGYNHLTPLIILIIFYAFLIIILSIITARKITHPLTKLKNAANSIENEEFDIELDYNGKDEISDVFTAFNDMRIRLKHIVQKQLTYEKNRTELISNISHDLRTPITSIKGYIEGLKDGVANTPEKVKRYHETIYKKVNLLDKLIENLFLFSKLDLKKIPFNFQEIEIGLFISDIIDEISYEDPTINIILKKWDTSIYVSADPIHLQRVVQNLISNAKKYNNKDVCILEIDIKLENNMVYLSFKDNGPGIAPENIDDMFKRFYRSDPARSSSTEGSGLGLAISKRIINVHNGDIFANNNIQDGLTITFTLPVTED